MSAFEHGPSLRDQGIGPEDMPFGRCERCTTTLDEGAMRRGRGVLDDAGRLLCIDCWMPASPASGALTRDDVRKLRSGGPELYGGIQGTRWESEWVAFLDSVADRIEALLPARESEARRAK